MTAPFSIRITLATPPQGGGDPSAMLDALVQPNEEIRKALSLGLDLLAKQAAKERFRGKGPFPVSQNRLGVVSGRLVQDLYGADARITADGYTGQVGSRLEYFGAHEVGFSGTVQVPAHTRDSYQVNRKRQTRTSKSGKPVSIRANRYSVLPHSVRAHSKKLNIPARKPLRTAIEEHAGTILGAEIDKAVTRISNKKS